MPFLSQITKLYEFEIGGANIIHLVLRLSLVLILIGLGLETLGAILIGTSVYLSFRQTGSPAATAPAGCESCSPSPDIIRQLPPLAERETPTPQPSPAAVLIKEATAQETRPAVISQQRPETTPTMEFLVLGDVVSQPPAAEKSQIASKLETALITATRTITKVDIISITSAQDVLTAGLGVSDDQEIEQAIVDQPKPVEEAVDYSEPYTSTDQVKPPPGHKITPAAPEEAGLVQQTDALGCPASSKAAFELAPMEGQPPKDHPGAVHGDLNLVLRGYIPAHESLELVDYLGNTDGDPPQLSGLFEPNRIPKIKSVYRVNDWIWDSSQCGGHPRGCPGPPANTFWPVTLAGLTTTPGEAIYIPERGSQIYRGGYVALVLYAEKQRITLGYTRRGSVVTGYVVHIEDICVNPNLVGLYRAQLDEAGWNDTGYLPALRNNQALGIAPGTEIKVAIRDAGSFMDPRSRKDWWK